MIEYLTEDDIAAETLMVRARFTGTILIIEGDSDYQFLKPFINFSNCYLLVAHGKENAIGAVQILESKAIKGILAIVDSDHCTLIGREFNSPNLLLTDVHDIELMIFQSTAFDKIISEYGSDKKIALFLQKNGSNNLRELILRRCLPLGMLRLISSEAGLNLRFKEIKYKTFIDSTSLEVNIDKYVNSIVSNTRKQGLRVDPLKTKLQNRLNNLEIDPYMLCKGHDLTEVISIGLRKALGSKVEAIACKENIETLFRLAYEWKHFIETALYRKIKLWETVNSPFIVLSTSATA